MWEIELPLGAEPIGYKWLVEKFHLKTLPHFRWSYTSLKYERKEYYFSEQNLTLYIYPVSYKLADDVFNHLEFALKNEGLNLFILKKIMLTLTALTVRTYVKSCPTGKYARMIWYLYEKFNQTKVDLPNLKQGSYVNLLDPTLYYSSDKPHRSPRHRIADNLMGSTEFAPMVRKTPLLKDYEKKDIGQIVQELTNKYDTTLMARAMRYMYTKETMSSWEIEREKPDHAKLSKFIGLLHKADSIGSLSEKMFVELQNHIIDLRFALPAYRPFQNYVGEEPGVDQLILHYISPKPENVSELMHHLIQVFYVLEKSTVNPVIVAAILAFMFVYIHPFEDGNGRMHRFLIHYALARMKFTPIGIVFPVSAAIARDMQRYDKVLESFSKPLLELITDYQVNENGEMVVIQETSDFYRYIDLTPMAEFLYECVDKTMTTEFQKELLFLAEYDNIKRSCKEVVDMPDQKVDLFIRCVRQNGGVLSMRKRELFSMLTDAEVKKMEAIIQPTSLNSQHL